MIKIEVMRDDDDDDDADTDADADDGFVIFPATAISIFPFSFVEFSQTLTGPGRTFLSRTRDSILHKFLKKTHF